MLGESVSQIVKQLGITWRIAQVQIVRWFDYAAAEVMCPNTIDDRPTKVRIISFAKPVHQRSTWIVELGQID